MPRFIFLKSPDQSRQEKELMTSSPAEVFDPQSLQKAAAMDNQQEQAKKSGEKLKIEAIQAELQSPPKEKSADIIALESDDRDPDGTELMHKIFKLKNPTEKTERALRLLEWMMETGKGNPVNIMFFACRALTEGSFSTHEIGELQKKSSNFPPIVFLTEVQSDPDVLNKIKEMDEKMFVRFYWSNIMPHPSVAERAEKSVRDNQIDHDHVGFIGPGISLETAKQFLTAKTSPTAINNFYAGTIMAIEENMENNNMTADFLRNFLMADRYLAGMNKDALREKPRMAGASNHPKKTMTELSKMMWNALEKLDKKLARFLREKDMNIFEVKDHLKNEYGVEVNSVGEIYNQIQVIAQKMVVRKPRSFFGKTGWDAFRKKLS